MKKYIAWSLIALYVAAAAAYSWPSRPASPAPERAAPPTLSELEHQAREGIRGALVDPDSAQFTAIRFGAARSVCGLVNAKNRFGGYAGERLFIYVQPIQEVLIWDGSDYFKQAYANYCLSS